MCFPSNSLTVMAVETRLPRPNVQHMHARRVRPYLRAQTLQSALTAVNPAAAGQPQPLERAVGVGGVPGWACRLPVRWAGFAAAAGHQPQARLQHSGSARGGAACARYMFAPFGRHLPADRVFATFNSVLGSINMVQDSNRGTTFISATQELFA